MKLMRMGATHWPCTACTEIVHADEVVEITDATHAGMYHPECTPQAAANVAEES